MSAPFVNSVFHPTDFSGASEKAFVHALMISLHRKTSLTILNVVQKDQAVDQFNHFPKVRTYLEEWGYLKPGSERSAVYQQLGVKIRKINLRARNIYRAAMNYLKSHSVDLMVLSTTSMQERPDVSLAEKLARNSKTMTMFVPENADGFVNKDDGTVSFNKVMVAVDRKPDPKAAITYAARAAAAFATNSHPIEIILTHVGEELTFPQLEEEGPHNWRKQYLSGPVVEKLVEAANQEKVDLLIMTTEGHNGILDIFKGSVTEQVLRKVQCPMLAVPAGILA